MKLLGLTGGIGMGKSTVAKLLAALGTEVIDTDDVAREVVQPGQPALAEIRASFGFDIVGPDGQLRREELARRVFSEPEARRRLEAILHPRIREIWLKRVGSWRQEGRELGVVVIPLLFETNAARHFDATICIACSFSTQLERLRARGWSDQQVEQRAQAQWSIEKKVACSDYVVWTEGSLDVAKVQLVRILGTLGLRPG